MPRTESHDVVIKAFEPYKGKVRKSGTGGIYEIKTIFKKGDIRRPMLMASGRAITYMYRRKKKCAELFEEMIAQVRTQIAEEKAIMRAAAEK